MSDLADRNGGQDRVPGPVVLLVEDDARIASFMNKGLKAAGFEVVWVTTGAEALDRIRLGGVSVHILDLGLPDIDGLVLMRDLNRIHATVPTVVVTARTDPRDRREAMSLGARFYLTKPFAWADLLSSVRTCADVDVQPAGA